MGTTLILSGLSERESRVSRNGVPILMNIPVLKYLFSTKTTYNKDSSVVILLTPRDPAYWDEKNRASLNEFVVMRRAYLRARQGTADDMRRFHEQYPNWKDLPPNRFASHFFLMNNSELYRTVSGHDLAADYIDLDLLGSKPKKK